MGDYTTTSYGYGSNYLDKIKTTTIDSFSIDIIQLVLFSSVIMNVKFFDSIGNFFDSVNLTLTTNGNSAHVYDTNIANAATAAASAATATAAIAVASAIASVTFDNAVTNINGNGGVLSPSLSDSLEAIIKDTPAIANAAIAAIAAIEAIKTAALNPAKAELNTASAALNIASVALNTASAALVKAVEYNYTNWGLRSTTTTTTPLETKPVTVNISVDKSQIDTYVVDFVTDYIAQVYLKNNK